MQRQPEERAAPKGSCRPSRLAIVTASVVVLVRHAQPVPPIQGSTATMDDESPLPEEGRVAAKDLAHGMRQQPVTAVFSSPYRRAVETVEPIAAVHGLEVRTCEDLRERRLSAKTLDELTFLEALRHSRADASLALVGGESADDVQGRALRVLERVLVATTHERNPDRRGRRKRTHRGVYGAPFGASSPSGAPDWQSRSPSTQEP